LGKRKTKTALFATNLPKACKKKKLGGQVGTRAGGVEKRTVHVSVKVGKNPNGRKCPEQGLAVGKPCPIKKYRGQRIRQRWPPLHRKAQSGPRYHELIAASNDKRKGRFRQQCAKSSYANQAKFALSGHGERGVNPKAGTIEPNKKNPGEAIKTHTPIWRKPKEMERRR